MAGPSTGLISPMADKVAFTFEGPGSTYGSVTGQYYQWDSDEPVVAPKNEFDHMPDGSYETRPLTPDEKSDDEGGETTTEETGGESEESESEESEPSDLLDLVEDVEALESEIQAFDGDLEALIDANEGSNGWYELPGVEKNLRADDALDLLELVVA